MAQISISRIFEVSQYLATDAGKQLAGALEYISLFAEQTLRNLRNGLTMVDNMDVLQKNVRVREAMETVILEAGSRRIVQVEVRQVVDNEFYVLTAFGWRYNTQGQVVIKCLFDGTPSADRDVELVTLLHFG